MTKLKKPVTLETTFGVYTVDELLGEGGAGRVYGGASPDGSPVAVKVLAEERASADKRGRFKNEISFLARNKHRNIVTVIDHGTEYRLISSVSKELSFLDEIVAKMLRQLPQERPKSVAELKSLIQRYQAEAVTVQRLSQLDGTVIAAREIDDPLAYEPPCLVGADWDGNRLILTLDREVSRDWVAALGKMGSYSSVMNKGPETFSFQGNQAFVNVQEHEVQPAIDHFKNWLPLVTRTLKHLLEQAAQRQEAEHREKLRREREAEERRLRVLRNIKI